MANNPISSVRAALQAYVDKDRAAIERLVADDFHFTSPLDNGLDRAAYMRICWPNRAGDQLDFTNGRTLPHSRRSSR